MLCKVEDKDNLVALGMGTTRTHSLAALHIRFQRLAEGMSLAPLDHTGEESNKNGTTN